MEYKSQEIGELAKALSQAQNEFTEIKKSSSVDYKTKKGERVKYEYAELSHFIEATRPALAKHGISVVQGSEKRENGLFETTWLIHSSGQWFYLELPIKPSDDPKALGSEITYKRKYMYQSVLCLASEDDDGSASSDAGPAKQENKKTSPYINENQRKKLLATFNDAGFVKTGKEPGKYVPDIERARNWLFAEFEIEHTTKIPKQKFNEILKSVGREGQEIDKNQNSNSEGGE